MTMELYGGISRKDNNLYIHVWWLELKLLT